MKLTNEDYKYKIINASPTRLVIVTYEIILDRISQAKVCLENGDNDGFIYNIDSAKQFVNALISSLDMNTTVALSMADLYFAVNKLLTVGFFKKDEQRLSKAEYIIHALKKGLQKEVDDGVSIMRSPALCATY